MLANKFYLQQPYSRVSKLNRMVCTSVQEIIINDEEFCTLATATSLENLDNKGQTLGANKGWDLEQEN